jgi:polysaccharide biosynthesis/export protein
MASRMVKKPASGSGLPRLLRPCLGHGASLGEEAVLEDSGRAGEVAARVGRVRSLNFLSNLPGIRSVAMLILFLAVLVGGVLSHDYDALGASPTAPEVDPSYRLGAEDVMMISVWKDEQLTREVVVRPDGMFSFPLVGDIQAEDRTVEEIRADLVKRLTKYIPNPNVSVAVMKVLSYKVYVVGRVNKPGEYLIGHYTDVLQALSLAGGLTPFAAENSIKVIRRIKGQQLTFPFRYGDVRKGNDLEQNILLQRGDVVMVP